MTQSIWGARNNPFIPPSIAEQECGLRPSVAKLIEHIDTADPAFPAIAEVLTDMVSAGVEIDEAIVQAAVKLGRQRYSRDVKHIPSTSSTTSGT